MNDTPADIQQRYHTMLLSRSGEERLKMGFSMNAMARTLVMASLLEKTPDATPPQLRQMLFLRLYGHEFDPQTKTKILQALAQDLPPSAVTHRVSSDPS